MTLVILPSSLTFVAPLSDAVALWSGTRVIVKVSPRSPRNCTCSLSLGTVSGIPFCPWPSLRPLASSTSYAAGPVMESRISCSEESAVISSSLQDDFDEERSMDQSRLSLPTTCSAMVRDLMISISAWMELSPPCISSSLILPSLPPSFLTYTVDEA